MSTSKRRCRGCGQAIGVDEDQLGRSLPCPSCGRLQTFQAESEPALGSLPERMKANRALAGNPCRACGREIDLGDDVHNCLTCGACAHVACRERLGGCAEPTCAEAPAARQPRAAAPAAGEGDTKPCRFCGELIRVTAKKCRFCGEFQSERLRQMAKQGTTEDSKLSGGEIAVGILCPLPAFIVSIVYLCQGKKKGLKLMLLAIGCFVFWNIFMALIGPQY